MEGYMRNILPIVVVGGIIAVALVLIQLNPSPEEAMGISDDWSLYGTWIDEGVGATYDFFEDGIYYYRDALYYFNDRTYEFDGETVIFNHNYLQDWTITRANRFEMVVSTENGDTILKRPTTEAE